MTLWLALRRLLPLLAVLSLALAPVAASAAAADMRAPTAMQGSAQAVQGHAQAIQGHAQAMQDGDMAGMAMDAMPCCPHETPAMPDCAKGCPLMALCLAKVAARLPGAVGLPTRAAVVQGTRWDGAASFRSLAQAPPSEPPRS
ncbi:hypothetical protein [uncultured Methylobacterium sp.]|uniref:hypothetical protein n=1 Tax=uncultured Methylobacterium sp. TaxID=157278 RepID=UPI0035CCA0EE